MAARPVDSSVVDDASSCTELGSVGFGGEPGRGDRADPPVDFAGVAGAAVEQIVAVVDEHDADLIVVGTRDPGFVDHFAPAASCAPRCADRARRFASAARRGCTARAAAIAECV
jgi:nucleotide-binding universal stress UspA family protein